MNYNLKMINTDLINKIFKNSYIEINTNHNEALNVFENYIKKSGEYIPALINFDTHSDVYINIKNGTATIANWVNFCFNTYKVTEFYWIIPNYITQNAEYKNIYQQKTNLNSGAFRSFDNIDLDLDNITKEQLLFDNNTNELISITKLESINKKCKMFNMPDIEKQLTHLIPIDINILTLSNLNKLKGKEVLLSVDADYFCNSGFDTTNRINNKDITENELTDNINLFLEKLSENEIIPIAVSLTYSPIYIQKKYYKNIEQFFNAIKEAGKN